MWADALPNLLIGLREGLEAGLVVSILLAAVRKQRIGSAPVWLGVAAAAVLALSFGAVLTFYRSVLPGTGQEALGGSLSVIAVGLVTWMVFWMRRTARNLTAELRNRVEVAAGVSAAALALTAFLAVGREGTETALFLWAAVQASGQSSAAPTAAPLAGAAVGICCAIVLCVLLYHRAVKIRLDKFFARTAILLIVVAGGVLAYGLGDLQEAGILPGHLWLAFDLSGHIDASSWWMSLITGVTELQVKMTWLQVVAYVCYLGVVLPLFILGKPAAAPATPMAAPDAVRGLASRRRVVATIIAAFTLPPLVAGGLIAFAPGASGAAVQNLTVTGTACAAGWTSAQAGAQTFAVSNKSGKVAEINLVQTASSGIVGEIETLGPGTSADLRATLSPGSYQLHCLIPGQATTTSALVAVTGSSGAAGTPLAVKPVTVAELRPALQAYNSYVAGKLTTLTGQVTRIRADLSAGDLAAARRDWLPAMLTWEQVGVEAYGSFGDFGVKIGAGPQGFTGGVSDPDFTGLHRLEYGLWHGQSAAALIPVTARLAADVAALRQQLPQLSNDPTQLPIRAHEILEDAFRDHLTGQLDQGSGASYAETLADVQADRVVLGFLTGLISERDRQLLPAVNSQLDTLQQALLATQNSAVSDSAVSDAPLAARQRVDAAIGAVLQTLSQVPDLLETPIH